MAADNTFFPPSKPSVLPFWGEAGDAALAAQIKALVQRAARIVITGHEKPDGDCIGSEVALCAILRESGFSAEIIASDPAPPKYQFLVCGGGPPIPGNPQVPMRVAATGERIDADLCFVLDATDLSRIGRVKSSIEGVPAIVNMDHHLANPNFGAVNWVDTRACATGELVWRLAASCQWPVPLLGMQALYAAMVTDTGQFSYSNTTPRALRMAAELVERGVDPEAIWQRIYLNKSHAELELENRVRASLKCIAGGRICMMTLAQEDFLATGTGPANTEEMISIPRSLQGVDLAIFFYALNGGAQTKVSLRSTRKIDAAALARRFGGGGHRQAAGFSFNGPIAEAQKLFLPVAEQAVLESPGS
ncbi:MAG TPA: bifunctional oligoribonuclease/PAP phosphatase NrnA [Planctomycetota bacterium]|jgi:phosphoesterase RecJ-like protein